MVYIIGIGEESENRGILSPGNFLSTPHALTPRSIVDEIKKDHAAAYRDYIEKFGVDTAEKGDGNPDTFLENIFWYACGDRDKNFRSVHAYYTANPMKLLELAVNNLPFRKGDAIGLPHSKISIMRK